MDVDVAVHQHGSDALWDWCPRDETLCNHNDVTDDDDQPESLSKRTEINHSL